MHDINLAKFFLFQTPLNEATVASELAKLASDFGYLSPRIDLEWKALDDSSYTYRLTYVYPEEVQLEFRANKKSPEMKARIASADADGLKLIQALKGILLEDQD